ncbi:MAG: hypothetical protein RI911_648 [Candidatus Parcubacteria bacterium]|jgi:hypothetical protein
MKHIGGHTFTIGGHGGHTGGHTMMMRTPVNR